MSNVRLTIALGVLTITFASWAVPVEGTAHSSLASSQMSSAATYVAPIRFREVRDRGLLVSGWVNGSGPYVFAIDTGAGVSMLRQDLVRRIGLSVRVAARPLVGGLSASAIAANQETTINQLALGTPRNVLPTKLVTAVAENLPVGLDGVIDPTQAFSPLGYSVDLPNHEIQSFDSTQFRLSVAESPHDGAVVRWARERGSHRPYVRLGDGRLALIDTGSGFGLAIPDRGPRGDVIKGTTVRDLGGGAIQSKRVAPVTVSIGALVLRSVPTDLLVGVAADTPLILGRDALYPFKITFDPTAQLIAIEPSVQR